MMRKIQKMKASMKVAPSNSRLRVAMKMKAMVVIVMFRWTRLIKKRLGSFRRNWTDRIYPQKGDPEEVPISDS